MKRRAALFAILVAVLVAAGILLWPSKPAEDTAPPPETPIPAAPPVPRSLPAPAPDPGVVPPPLAPGASLDPPPPPSTPELRVDGYRLEGDRVAFKTAGADLPEDALHRWDFGDGATAETRSAYVEHDYGLRDMEGPTSTFRVRVRAKSEDGEWLRAETRLTLANDSRDIAVLPERYVLRPEGERGPVQGRAKLRSRLDRDVDFSGGDARPIACDEGAPFPTVPLAAAAVEPPRLPAGALHLVTVSLPDPVRGDDICAVEIRLAGADTKGTPREVRWTVRTRGDGGDAQRRLQEALESGSLPGMKPPLVSPDDPTVKKHLEP